VVTSARYGTCHSSITCQFGDLHGQWPWSWVDQSLEAVTAGNVDCCELRQAIYVRAPPSRLSIYSYESVSMCRLAIFLV
jgi:hypothetical protein